ncbi:hypothetical protein KOR42_15130 [Thalassoglobus neptunius]|uniref:Uncharacterized protein n=1 Tax=Thalassoglobus neptunius TaxID=1938619 RepID=A0A5C5X8E6_9PLAN|nr:hypothetical protein [Thalassoglobus neptunius]TWT58142.1 hypothetical protein KOR42_15130 [Thalassoglobus neptunius]
MQPFLNPSLWELVQFRTTGRIRSLLSSFTHPRRLVISILGAVLAFVWLGNAIASVLFRESYNPKSFQIWMTAMLTIYAGWHLLRVSWQRPDAAIEWTPAEKMWLMTSPFRRSELLKFRLFTVLSATTIKAAIGAILLLPDLPIPWLGFLGLWTGLAIIELFRIVCDLVATGLKPDAYRSMRAFITVSGAALLSALTMNALELTRISQSTSELPTFIILIKSGMHVIQDWFTTTPGLIVSAPMLVFVQLILTPTLTIATAAEVFTVLLMVAAMAGLVIRLDKWNVQQITRREKDIRNFNELQRAESECNDLKDWKLPATIFQKLGGAVTWRQFVGLQRHSTGILLALIPPAILSAIPLFMPQISDQIAIVNFLGGLTFYTFLLLPSAMKFDFRRDYDYLLLLKMLPQPAWRVVLSQIATPVLVTTGFQLGMIAIAALVRGMSPGLLLASILSFPVMNLAIYSWENLIFLIFPQRLKQEGIEVFLLTTVIFTAKGLAFACVFALMFAWAMVSGRIASQLADVHGMLGNQRIIFGVGVWISIALSGFILTRLAARQFEKLDASMS